MYGCILPLSKEVFSRGQIKTGTSLSTSSEGFKSAESVEENSNLVYSSPNSEAVGDHKFSHLTHSSQYPHPCGMVIPFLSHITSFLLVLVVHQILACIFLIFPLTLLMGFSLLESYTYNYFEKFKTYNSETSIPLPSWPKSKCSSSISSSPMCAPSRPSKGTLLHRWNAPNPTEFRAQVRLVI